MENQRRSSDPGDEVIPLENTRPVYADRNEVSDLLNDLIERTRAMESRIERILQDLRQLGTSAPPSEPNPAGEPHVKQSRPVT